ncbi:MAG: paraquat-inducible protein A, partial [Bacteroidota bacterium]
FGARQQWFQFVRAIGKWSMADVFVVGVFLAFLATRSNENINAALHPGFYYFLAYCLISLLAIQVMKVE